jgi:hypothetical protein
MFSLMEGSKSAKAAVNDRLLYVSVRPILLKNPLTCHMHYIYDYGIV